MISCIIGGGGLLSGTNAQDKNLAFSKVVRKAYRTVFKRVIRPLLNRNFSNQLPLCTSNHCIVLPGTQSTTECKSLLLQMPCPVNCASSS